MSIADRLRDVADALNECDRIFAEDADESGGRAGALAALLVVRSFFKGCFSHHAPMRALEQLTSALADLELGISGELLKERQKESGKSGALPTSMFRLKLEGNLAAATTFLNETLEISVSSSAAEIAGMAGLMLITDKRGNAYDEVAILSLRSNAMRKQRPMPSRTVLDGSLYAESRHTLLPQQHAHRHHQYVHSLKSLYALRAQGTLGSPRNVVLRNLVGLVGSYPRAYSYSAGPIKAKPKKHTRERGRPRGRSQRSN